MDMPAQGTALPLCFSSPGASVARVMPAPMGEGACLYSVLTANVPLRHLTDTPRSDAVDQLSSVPHAARDRVCPDPPWWFPS